MVEYLKGDLLKVQKEKGLNVICHQVNCQGVMGSGIARQIRNTYPRVYSDYVKKCETGTEEGKYPTLVLLGDIQIVPLDYEKDTKLQVCNFFSQDNFGYDGRRYTSYDAFWSCLNKLAKALPEGSSIGFPARIGCDRGGADWYVINAMIMSVLGNRFNVYIVEWDGGK